MKFSPEDADKQELGYKKDWRSGETGEWVLCDDGWVVQVLKKYYTKTGDNLLRFAHCTIPIRKKMQLTTVGNHRSSIISSGKSQKRKYLSHRNKMLIDTFIKVKDWSIAYRGVYGNKRRQGSIDTSLSRLFGLDSFKEYFAMAIKNELDDAGLTKDYVFKSLQKFIDGGSKHGYEALIKLMELHDISEPNRGVLGIPMMELNQIEPATFEDVEGEQKDEDKV